MDPLVRGGRPVLTARRLAVAWTFAAVGAGSACGPAALPSDIGASESPIPEKKDAVAAATAGPATPLPLGWKTKFHALGTTPVASLGHAAGRWDGAIWVDDGAAKALASPADFPAFPAGARLVEEHTERVDGTAGPTFYMEKGALADAGSAAWRYVVLGADGGVLADGTPEACVGCHDDAPKDRVFIDHPP